LYLWSSEKKEKKKEKKKKEKRSCCLDSLLDKGNDFNGPWLCIGDFNMILSQSEKYGGWPYACLSNDPFHSFLNSFGMVDLGFSRNPLT
jgi:hypothetical protein